MSKIPVIIDCDPGIDDAIAVIMLAASEKVDVKAITTTHGNVGLEGTTKNALALKDFLGMDCIVAKGASKPMIVPLKDASVVHGANGLGGYELPAATSVPAEEAAWDVMYKVAKEAGELTLVVLGPMTNTAITVLKYPDFKNYVKRIYMMGGSRNHGNHSQNAEFNIWGDPHACQVVLESGIPITMADMQFGLDYQMTGAELMEIYSHAKKLKPMLDQFIKHDHQWIPIYEAKWGRKCTYEEIDTVVYDATAAAALLLDGDCLETKDYFVICETQGTETEGQTVFDYKNHFNRQPNVQLAVKMDKEKFFDLIRNSVAKFE